MDIEKILRENNGTIIDVRSRKDFKGGHVQGCVNIPFDEIHNRMGELKNMKCPFILCCATGKQSQEATELLIKEGFECYNGGAWFDVDYFNHSIQNKVS